MNVVSFLAALVILLGSFFLGSGTQEDPSKRAEKSSLKPLKQDVAPLDRLLGSWAMCAKYDTLVKPVGSRGPISGLLQMLLFEGKKLVLTIDGRASCQWILGRQYLCLNLVWDIAAQWDTEPAIAVCRLEFMTLIFHEPKTDSYSLLGFSSHSHESFKMVGRWDADTRSLTLRGSENDLQFRIRFTDVNNVAWLLSKNGSAADIVGTAVRQSEEPIGGKLK